MLATRKVILDIVKNRDMEVCQELVNVTCQLRTMENTKVEETHTETYEKVKAGLLEQKLTLCREAAEIKKGIRDLEEQISELEKN